MQPLNSGICYMRPRIPLATTSPNRGFLPRVVVALPEVVRGFGPFYSN